MSGARDSLEHSAAAPRLSESTRRAVQDGTAAHVIASALECGAATRSPFGTAILEALVAAGESGELRGVSLYAGSRELQGRLERLGFNRHREPSREALRDVR